MTISSVDSANSQVIANATEQTLKTHQTQMRSDKSALIVDRELHKVNAERAVRTMMQKRITDVLKDAITTIKKSGDEIRKN
ncbi:hypothetical protein [Epibacterium ulvae]|uniref:hypothetical protein n=1 Tax=Epibacterium ulvae TaxID=1156985 RepID=UPI002493579F|nr:hypothetical protein [Epibacterium ulvae]